MRTSKYTMVLAVLALLSSRSPAQEPVDSPKPPAAPPEPIWAHKAELDITVLFDPGFAVSQEALDVIVGSKHLAGEAIAELTGKRLHLKSTHDGGRLTGIGNWKEGWSPENSNKGYFAYLSPRHSLISGMTLDPGNSHSLRLTVAVGGKATEAEAEKYADLMIKHLNNVLAELSRRAFERKRAEINLAAEQAQKTVELARQKLNETRDSVRRASGDFSESIVQELVTSLKKQEQALQVELAGMKGRAAALQLEVAKTAERAKKDPADDEIVKNLIRVIELRMQQLRYLKELGDTGAITQAEAAKGEEQVALAKVELAQAKRANSRPASDQLDKLNSELGQIAVSLAESEAKLKYVTEQLELHAHILRDAADAKPLREQLDKQTAALVTLQVQADQAAAEVRQLESSFRPARVEVFELTTSEDKPANAAKSEKR